MKLGIVGSRSFDDYELVNFVVHKLNPSVIVSGGAPGADTQGERYATEHNLPTIIHRADWDKYGKSAGFRRNKQIVDGSDRLVAFWDGHSLGTKSTIDLAAKSNKLCDIYIFQPNTTSAKDPSMSNEAPTCLNGLQHEKFSLYSTETKDKAQFSVWNGSLRIGIVPEQQRQGEFNDCTLNVYAVEAIRHVLKKLEAAGPGTREPIIIQKWEQETGKYGPYVTLIFFKDTALVYGVEIQMVKASGKFIFKTAGGLTLGTTPMNPATSASLAVAAFNTYLDKKVPVMQVLSTRKPPKGGPGSGGGGGGFGGGGNRGGGYGGGGGGNRSYAPAQQGPAMGPSDGDDIQIN